MNARHLAKSCRGAEKNEPANRIMHATFEGLRTFLYVLMSVVKVFVYYKLWVNATVTIFLAFFRYHAVAFPVLPIVHWLS